MPIASDLAARMMTGCPRYDAAMEPEQHATPKYLTTAESEAMAESFGTGLRPREREWAGTAKRKPSIEVLNGPRYMAFARAACWWTYDRRPGRVLLYVTEYGVWEEHPQFEAALRLAAGDTTTIEQTRGLVSPWERHETLLNYLIYCLLVGRGVVLLGERTGRWFECDHDGRAWVGAKDAGAVEQAREWLDWV